MPLPVPSAIVPATGESYDHIGDAVVRLVQLRLGEIVVAHRFVAHGPQLRERSVALGHGATAVGIVMSLGGHPPAPQAAPAPVASVSEGPWTQRPAEPEWRAPAPAPQPMSAPIAPVAPVAAEATVSREEAVSLMSSLAWRGISGFPLEKDPPAPHRSQARGGPLQEGQFR